MALRVYPGESEYSRQLAQYERQERLDRMSMQHESNSHYSCYNESYQPNVSDTYLNTDSFEYNQMYWHLYPPNGGFFFIFNNRTDGRTYAP